MGKKDRLKNGFDMLFEDNYQEHEENSEKNGGIENVRISLIEPDRNQPRKEFDSEKLNELAENIRIHGVLQPILVRKIGDGYQIVAGERRWRASRIAGLTEIPVIVRNLTDAESAQIALIENIQRQDLNPLEEATAYKRLAEEFGMKQEEIAKIVGKSRASVANSMRLLKLGDGAKQALENKLISVGHAKILCSFENEDDQKAVLEQIIQREMSVRQLEDYASKYQSVEKKEKAEKKSKKDASNQFGGEDYALFTEAKTAIYNEYGIAPQFKRLSNGTVIMEMGFGNDEMFKEFLKRISEK